MPIVEIKNVSKLFKSPSGDVHVALKGVSLQIHQGQIQGIIGMSGAGKSTLMRCLVGLEIPTSGEILFHGENIVCFDEAQKRLYRHRIGMIFQHFNLFSSRTVAENIAYPLEIHGASQAQIKERVDELLDLVHLSHKKDAYPARLSGGERQRIGIARALANHPDVLFCDEATSALDPNTMGSILELLQELNQRLNITIVAITHQLEVVKQICTHVAVISDGEIVEQGTVQDLFNTPAHPVTRNLLKSQLPSPPKIEWLDSGQPTEDLYRLNFKGDSVKQPVIAQLLRAHHVTINILQANIDSFQTMVFGFLVVEIRGSEEAKNEALNFLLENHVHWEKIT